MKVQELLEILKKLPQDSDILTYGVFSGYGHEIVGTRIHDPNDGTDETVLDIGDEILDMLSDIVPTLIIKIDDTED